MLRAMATTGDDAAYEPFLQETAEGAARVLSEVFDRLLDAAYIWMPFPTCWCVARLPDDLPLRLEAAYRAELIYRPFREHLSPQYEGV